MGQAKIRGDREARRREALERVQAGQQLPKVEAIREAHEIDADAAFRGYVVRLPDDDTFVSALDVSGGDTRVKLVKGPEQAQRFRDASEALQVAAGFERAAEVGALFETARQLLVAPVAGNAHATAAGAD